MYCRFIFIALATMHMLRLTEKDIIYNVLPFYNVQNIMTGVGPCIVRHIPIVIKKAFDPNDYFMDCKKYKCTVSCIHAT